MSFVFTPPTPAPSPSAPTACTPGRGGIPGSAFGRLLCGQWASDAPHSIWLWLSVHWRLAVVAVVLVVAARLGWALVRRIVWSRHAAHARWLQIIPPVTATPAATVGLWRLLATLLPAPRRLAIRPARLVWEVAATPTGMRCGIWVPPGINPTAVMRVVQRAWPGARIEHARPPAVPATYPVVGLAVRPTRPDWLPLLDDPPPATAYRSEGTPVEEDRMRAVFDGLASAGRTGGGLLQVVVGRAPSHRVTVLRRATLHPGRARQRRGTARVIGVAADGLRAVLRGVLDVVTSGPPASRRHHIGDPYLADLARQARARYATAPHLLLAVHTVASGPTLAAARAAAADITSGYGLLGAHLTRRRIHRPTRVARRRWAAEPRMALSTVVEIAAVAGLPAEPAAYGLPAAASRRRPASHEVFTAGPAPISHPTRRPVLAAPELPADGTDTLWITR